MHPLILLIGLIRHIYYKITCGCDCHWWGYKDCGKCRKIKHKK